MRSIMAVINTYINKQNKISLPIHTLTWMALWKKKVRTFIQTRLFSEPSDPFAFFFFLRVFWERPYFTKVKEITSEELMAGTCI